MYGVLELLPKKERGGWGMEEEEEEEAKATANAPKRAEAMTAMVGAFHLRIWMHQSYGAIGRFFQLSLCPLPIHCRARLSRDPSFCPLAALPSPVLNVALKNS